MTIKYSHGDVVVFDKTAVALGTFDGLHVAHMKIINRASEYASSQNIKCGIMMFDNIPSNVVRGGHVPQLMTTEDRCRLLTSLDFIYTESFSSEFSEKTPVEFVKYLKNVLKAEAVSVGYNYRFGKNASGDVNLLKELCKNEGIKVFVIDKTEVCGDVVSSTRIRSLVADGKMDEAETLLGRPFFITGLVNHGYRNGHKMGIPTANLVPPENVVRPKQGVYAGLCTVGNKTIKSVINVGNNPTFDGGSVTIECHLLDYKGDLYGKEIAVHFITYIRGEIKFKTPDELVAQIREDIKITQKELSDFE